MGSNYFDNNGYSNFDQPLRDAPVDQSNPYNINQQYSTPYDDARVQPRRRLHDRRLFYQIARFPNKNQHHHVKKYIFDEQMDNMSMKEYWLTKQQVRILMEKKPAHQYKCYPVYGLKSTPPPTAAELLVAGSLMMAREYDYTGYAPF